MEEKIASVSKYRIPYFLYNEKSKQSAPRSVPLHEQNTRKNKVLFQIWMHPYHGSSCLASIKRIWI
jgi:hypothetical protein